MTISILKFTLMVTGHLRADAAGLLVFAHFTTANVPVAQFHRLAESRCYYWAWFHVLLCVAGAAAV